MRSRSARVAQQRGDGGRQGHRIRRGHEQAVDAIGDDLRDAADGGGHDGTAARHRLEDRDALRLTQGRKRREREVGRDRGDVLPAAGEYDSLSHGPTQGRCLRAQRIGLRALADDGQPGVGDHLEDRRHRLDQVAVALLGLESRDHADQRRTARDAELVAHPTGRHRGGEAREVDAVGDDREARRLATLAAHLVLDARRRDDQPIHGGRQRGEELDILGRADAR